MSKASDPDANNEVDKLRALLESQEQKYEQQLLAMREQYEQEKKKVNQIMMEAIKQQNTSGAGSEVEQLRARIEEMEAQLQEAASSTTISPEMQEYETQLNDYRTQLEEAQNQLTEQEKQLQDRLRQTELDLSRERASMARQQASVERIRKELRIDLERTMREFQNMEQHAAVQKLRGQQVDANTGSGSHANLIADRLKEFLERLEPQ